jgi:hypothetical protein
MKDFKFVRYLTKEKVICRNTNHLKMFCLIVAIGDYPGDRILYS